MKIWNFEFISDGIYPVQNSVLSDKTDWSVLLLRHAMPTGKYLPNLQRSAVSPNSYSNNAAASRDVGLLDPEDGGTALLRNCHNC
jgi:hypothetical protein